MTMLWLVAAVLCLFVFPVSACGMGGIGAPSAGAIIGLCILFAPVVIPVGAGFVTYQGIKKGVRKIGSAKAQKDQRRKRNSDVIKTQMSRALKQVGKENFAKFIQELFDKAKEIGDAKSYFDLGVALFLNKDLVAAEEYLSKAIEINEKGNAFPQIAFAWFMRGMANQYLWSFKQAMSDFETSIKVFEENPPEAPTGADAAGVPQLTILDAYNSHGFASMLHALYDLPADDPNALELLNCAIAQFGRALGGLDFVQGMWRHNRGVARYFRTYRFRDEDPEHPDELQEKIRRELELALEDFNAAINSGNFGTSADGYAMAAQTMFRLNKQGEWAGYLDLALQADPKVFTVNVYDAQELSTPWPLPIQDFPFKKSPHDFKQVAFHKPTWCNHCMEFIKNPQGYSCQKCRYQVHSKCFPQVKAKSCFNDKADYTMVNLYSSYGMRDCTTNQFEKRIIAQQTSHTHHFKPVWFHKPTWCDFCSKFVISPLGKQGYSCVDCRYNVHKDCASQAQGYIEN